MSINITNTNEMERVHAAAFNTKRDFGRGELFRDAEGDTLLMCYDRDGRPHAVYLDTAVVLPGLILSIRDMGPSLWPLTPVPKDMVVTIQNDR